MQGQLFEIFNTTVPSYFMMLMTGFILATVMGALWAKRVGHNPDVVVDLGLAMLLAGVAGARLLHVFADGYFWDYVHLCTDHKQVAWPISRAECLAPVPVSAMDQLFGCAKEASPTGLWDYAAGVCRPATQNCWAWAEFWSGGLTYYGGFISASVAAWFILKADRFPFWRAADMAGMVVPLGLGFGRMGCLLAGCCFGKPTDSPLALSFPPFSPAVDWQVKAKLLEKTSQSSLPVHPTQIYESAVALAISAFLILYVHRRKRYDGHVFLAFVALYAVARAILEVWRSDDRGGLGFLSTSQLIGIALVGGVLWLHRWRTRSLAGASGAGEEANKTG